LGHKNKALRFVLQTMLLYQFLGYIVEFSCIVGGESCIHAGTVQFAKLRSSDDLEIVIGWGRKCHLCYRYANESMRRG